MKEPPTSSSLHFFKDATPFPLASVPDPPSMAWSRRHVFLHIRHDAASRLSISSSSTLSALLRVLVSFAPPPIVPVAVRGDTTLVDVHLCVVNLGCEAQGERGVTWDERTRTVAMAMAKVCGHWRRPWTQERRTSRRLGSGRKCRKEAGRTRASEGQVGGHGKLLPVFPLGMVGMPNCKVSLHIFEARYRVLFNTLLSGDQDVEEGLVDRESAFLGTRRFGLVFVTDQGQLAEYGSTLEIEQHRQIDGGRMLVVQRGVERFKITEVVQEKPYLICKVETVDDEDEIDEEAVEIAKDTAQKFRDTIKLGMKEKGMPLPEDPTELDELEPKELSFWIASMFDAPVEQQNLLEMRSTKERLQRENEVLKSTLDYLVATSALKSALNQSSPGDAPPESTE